MPSLKMSENSIRQIAFARRSWWRRLWWRRIEPDHTCYLVMPDGASLSFPNQKALDKYIGAAYPGQYTELRASLKSGE